MCERTAVWRMDNGPVVNSCCSSCATSNSLEMVSCGPVCTPVDAAFLVVRAGVRVEEAWLVLLGGR